MGSEMCIRDSDKAAHFVKYIKSSHLFAKQGDWALPLMAFMGEHKQYYTASGLIFSLINEASGEMRCFVDQRSGFTLFNDGRTVVRHKLQKSGQHAFEIYGPGGRVRRYKSDATKSLQASDFYGVFVDRSHKQILYALEPGHWMEPVFGDDYQQTGAKLSLNLTPSDRPLICNRRLTQVQARIWSDPGLGGDGSIKNIIQEDGETISSRGDIKVGPNAMEMLDIRIRADGIMCGVEGDDAGQPVKLVRFRRDKTSGRYFQECHDINALFEEAVLLNMDDGHG